MLEQHFGACRFVYNYFLRQRIDYYSEHSGQKTGHLSYYDTAKLLTKMKRQKEYTWLNDVNAQILQQSLRNLDCAYKNFFEYGAEFPRFKSKRSKQSFRIPQYFRLDHINGTIIFNKRTAIKIIRHRPIEGQMKSVTISRSSSGKYFAAILCQIEVASHIKRNKRVIGIDLGLKNFAVISDGERIDPPKYFRKSEMKLARLQRRLSRRKSGSGGYEKARLKVARLHEKIANQRADFLHKLSRRLVDESQAIYVEDLNVKGMLRNRHLSKSIMDAGWGEFIRQLEYKSQWYGCHFAKIDRFFPSSKRHMKCGYIYQDLSLSEREWICLGCGELVDRDANAAQNILNFGQSLDYERTVGTTGTQRQGNSVIRRNVELGNYPH